MARNWHGRIALFACRRYTPWSMKARLVESTHNDFKWEVYAPAKMFGKRIRKGFKNKTEATRYKNQLNNEFENNQIAPLDPKVHLLVARYQNQLSLQDIEEALIEKLEQNNQCQMTFKEACDHHLEQLKSDSKGKDLADGQEDLHLRDYEKKMPAICERFGNPKLHEITKAHCDEFKNEQLERVAPRTVKNYLNMISAVLNHCIREGFTTRNATKLVKLDHKKPEVHILKPKEVQKLLEHSGWLMRAFIMFACFGGARSSEVHRLRWEDVHLDKNQFFIPGTKNVNAERWVTLTPPLRAYCEEMLTPPANAAPGWKRTGLVLKGVCYNTIARHRKKLEQSAGVMILQNAMRHSYGSHHLEKWDNSNKSALEMGHHSPQVTFNHYRRAVTKKQAEKYWQITPAGGIDEEIPANIIAA